MDNRLNTPVNRPHELRLVGDPLPAAGVLSIEAAHRLPSLVWACDAADQLLYFNPAWRAYTGQDAGHWLDAVHPDDLAQVANAYAAARESGKPFSLPLRLRRDDAEYGWVFLQASPIEGAGFIGACADISPLAHLLQPAADEQSRVEQIAGDLARCTRDLDDFAHIASHDLKEPLRGIHTHAAFALEDTASLDPALATRLRTILQLVHRSESIINSLLHLAHAGRASLRRLPTSLGDLAAQVAGTLQPFLEEHHASIEISPLPQVLCDPPWIAEVLAHLLVNAVKFNDQEHKRVRIFADNRHGEVIITVEDDGIGIPEQHREAVFRLCKRLHQRHRYGGGIGSGLTLCRRILERHGGTIWVEPGESRGTRIRFTLPQRLEGADGRQ
jgi:signal transduction histidine kinase